MTAPVKINAAVLQWGRTGTLPLGDMAYLVNAGLLAEAQNEFGAPTGGHVFTAGGQQLFESLNKAAQKCEHDRRIERKAFDRTKGYKG